MRKLLIFILIFSDVSFAKIHRKSPESKFIKKSRLRGTTVSFSVMDVETGKTIISHNSKRSMIPASVAKVLSSFYALKVLGPDYQYETRLDYKGKIKNNKLDGQLYLVGGGDPFLTNAHLLNMLLTLKEKSIKEIDGSFSYNDDFLSNHSEISKEAFDSQTFNSSLGGLNAEFNQIYLWRYGRSRKTYKSKFEPVPDLDHFKIKKTKGHLKNKAKFSSKNNSSTETIYLSNLRKYKRVEEIPVKDASLFTANLFKNLGESIGIKIPKPGKRPLAKGLKNIYIHKSPKLLELAKNTMEYSNNLFAEILMMTAAKKEQRKSLSIYDSAKKMEQWFEKKYKFINSKTFKFINGSGLTTKSSISTEDMSDLLTEFYFEKFGKSFFPTLMSVSGQSGWLAKRMRTPDIALKVWAKTGSLDYVNNLAGYFMSNKGKVYAFTIFINHKKNRAIMDKRKHRLRKKIVRKSNRWRDQAIKLQENLLKHWVEIL